VLGSLQRRRALVIVTESSKLMLQRSELESELFKFLENICTIVDSSSISILCILLLLRRIPLP